MKSSILFALMGTIASKKSFEEMAMDSSMDEFLTAPVMDAVSDLTAPYSNFLENTLLQTDNQEEGFVLSINPKS